MHDDIPHCEVCGSEIGTQFGVQGGWHNSHVICINCWNEEWEQFEPFTKDDYCKICGSWETVKENNNTCKRCLLIIELDNQTN